MRVIGRRALAASLAVALCGCTSWHLQTGVTPQDVVARKHWKELRVTTVDGHQEIVVHAPRLSGDTLVGTSGDSAVAIPLSRIAFVERARSDVLPAVIGLYLVVGLVGLVWWADGSP